MTILRCFLIALTFCCLVFSGDAQPPAGWNSLKFGELTLSYPRTWHMTKDVERRLDHVTLTPDSMQHLTMRLFDVHRLPVSGDHNYTYLKKNFAAFMKSADTAGTKVLRWREINFKGRKCLYAELIQNSLPVKVYAIDAGDNIYLVYSLQRRYIQVADAGMERDGAAIVNSIAIHVH